MNKWILIIGLFIASGLNAQTRELMFVIDTLVFHSEQQDTIYLRVRNQGASKWEEDVETMQVVKAHAYPNFIHPVRLKHDSVIIELPIDNNYGFIELKNCYKLIKDTLKISKLEIFETKPADSTFTIMYFWKKLDGQLAKSPYKVKVKKKGTDLIAPADTISVKINGINYRTKMTISREEVKVVRGHRYKPKKYLTKEGDYKKRLTYIHFDQRLYAYYWRGKIHFQE